MNAFSSRTRALAVSALLLSAGFVLGCGTGAVPNEELEPAPVASDSKTASSGVMYTEPSTTHAPFFPVPGATVGVTGYPTRFLTMLDNRFFEINTLGQVIEQDLTSFVGNPQGIPGSLVAAAGSPARFVIAMHNWKGDRLLVLNEAGEFWAHGIGQTIGGAYKIDGSFNPAETRFVFAMGERLFVITSAGQVQYYLFPYLGNNGSWALGPYAIPGSLVAVGGRPALAVTAVGNRILVLNTAGEVWAHDVGTTIGSAYKLAGTYPGAQVRYIAPLPAGDGMVVVDEDGSVWDYMLP